MSKTIDEEQQVAQETQAANDENNVQDAVKNESSDENFKELYLRVSADFQNFKRRVEKQRLSWMEEGVVKSLKELLPLIDDLERALSSAAVGADTGLRTGLELILKNAKKRLSNIGVKEIDCSGAFDPHLHEALIEVASDDHESGHIIDVLDRGYVVGDTVIRHAKVSVAK